MMADQIHKTQLLEPWYAFRLELPSDNVGRAMNDIQNMGGSFDPPETGADGDTTLLTGTAPASTMRSYPMEVVGYTRGRGHLTLTLDGYRPCHNAAEVIEAAGDTGVTEYVGTGAYKFVEWKQDQYIHLTRYEDYVAADGKASGYTGKVSAPTKDIYYQFVTEASTRVSGFETGEYDVAGEIPTENYHDFDGNDDVKLYTHNAGVLTAFLNMNEGVFADEEIRKCALMAIDCEAAALAAYGEKELFNIDPNLGNPENTQWATDAGKKYFNQADAKAAKKALAKTSYAGETVKLLTTPDYKDMYNATVALQEQLEKAGFTAEVDSYEFATFMDIRSGKPEQWDLFVASTNYKPIPAQSLSASKAFYGLSDEKALKLAAEDTDAAAKKWAEAQERLYEIAVIEPLCHYVTITGTQADVEDVEVLDGAIVWNAKRPE